MSKKDLNGSIQVFEGKEGMVLREVWKSKPLTERDLNIPKCEKINVTGSMSLNKGLYDIDQRHYFRDVVFGALSWVPKKYWYDEHANAIFHLKVNGIYYGSKVLELKHDARTDTKSYSQKTSMTRLRWGEFKPFISKVELVGQTLKIYIVDDMMTEFMIQIENDTIS